MQVDPVAGESQDFNILSLEVFRNYGVAELAQIN